MENLNEQMIEAFLEGSLSGTQLQQFESRLKQDPELLAQLNLTKELHQRLEDWHKENLKTEWKDFIANNPPDRKKGKVIPIRTLGIISVAATVLLLLFLEPLKNMFSDQDPYKEFFTHLARDNANLSGNAEDGMQAYDVLNYKRAYPGLLQEVAEGGDSLNLIYASVAAIGSQQAEKAISLLEPLLGAERWQVYQVEIQWYLALAYLQEGETEKAQELLNTLSQTPNQYQNEATLLRALIDNN